MSGHGEVLQQAAFDAIEDNGEPITLVRVVTGTPDPVTGEAAQTRKEQTVQAIVAKASGGVIQAFDNRLEKGTLIETHLRAVMVAGLGLKFDPMPGDKAEFDDSVWTVLGTTPERAEGLNITFNLTVQR
ncbi:hypothetical protein [Mesoterricola silvestris]|uniref:Uncharacterized protein n=1 Tax=Mesoterricola silvestris TaxID=2927979 RepID=A0AA48K8K1_9BACT|nr:hypothetical protein [Mesoterricola silvestris]BDU72396.1 hypothetical protein METEAL_15700 [Mesoterricola silvestris]